MRDNVTIYIFGNPLLDIDSTPIKLMPELKKRFPGINFLLFDPNENLKPINKELIIIDTVVGIDKVSVIDDINKIQTEKIYSAHDLDLGLNLKLLKKLGKLDKAVIYGIPQSYNIKKALQELNLLLEKI